MRTMISFLAAPALAIALCGTTNAPSAERAPGVSKQSEAAVVQVLGDIGSGSGFFYDATQGLIATTASTVAGQNSLSVVVPGQQPVSAQILGSDLCQDLAVLKLPSPPSGLTGLSFGDSDEVFAGDALTSLGYPDAGKSGAKVVAIPGEAADEPLGDYTPAPSSPDYPSLVYHSAAVKGGDIGGPVLNSDGDVVGINTGAWVEEEGQLALAISSNQAKSELPDLAAGQVKNDPGWWLLAVSDPGLPNDPSVSSIKQPVQNAQKRLQDEGIDGLFIGAVRADSPAGKANLQQGAVITTVNGEGVSSFSELCNVLDPASPGEKLSLEGVYSGVGAAGHAFGDTWSAELSLEGTP
ncbi:S1C family serine protease [Streptomyces sp. NPDC049837]|uniref:S1C family serine protease n=1 Tax=Streptomyces sp. NPDC049837 TaxID=3155277 RepID=UPI0034320471